MCSKELFGGLFRKKLSREKFMKNLKFKRFFGIFEITDFSEPHSRIIESLGLQFERIGSQ